MDISKYLKIYFPRYLYSKHFCRAKPNGSICLLTNQVSSYCLLDRRFQVLSNYLQSEQLQRYFTQGGESTEFPGKAVVALAAGENIIIASIIAFIGGGGGCVCVCVGGGGGYL